MNPEKKDTQNPKANNRKQIKLLLSDSGSDIESNSEPIYYKQFVHNTNAINMNNNKNSFGLMANSNSNVSNGLNTIASKVSITPASTLGRAKLPIIKEKQAEIQNEQDLHRNNQMRKHNDINLKQTNIEEYQNRGKQKVHDYSQSNTQNQWQIQQQIQQMLIKRNHQKLRTVQIQVQIPVKKGQQAQSGFSQSTQTLSFCTASFDPTANQLNPVKDSHNAEDVQHQQVQFRTYQYKVSNPKNINHKAINNPSTLSLESIRESLKILKNNNKNMNQMEQLVSNLNNAVNKKTKQQLLEQKFNQMYTKVSKPTQMKNQLEPAPVHFNMLPKAEQEPIQKLYHFYADHSQSKLIDKSIIPSQNEVKISKVSLYYPYKPYQVQIKYMDAVIQALQKSENALLESPTGTGKTLSLLCSVLAWVEQFTRLNIGEEKVNVIYCSRTHTQLRQVQSELQKTCYRPTMSNFGSRDQFCIKTQFMAIKGRDLMESCSKAVKLFLKSKRKLQIQQNNSYQPNPTPKSKEKIEFSQPNEKKKQKQQSHLCYYYKLEGQYNKILQQRYKNKIITSQKIRKEGETHGFCPYYYPFQIKQKADLIFMPYNYILDVDRLPRYQNIVKNSIIIFDEAHNVPDASCQGRSFSIFARIFQNIDAQLRKLEYHPSMSPQLRQAAYVYEATRYMLDKQMKYLKKELENQARDIYGRLSQQEQYHTQQQYDLQQIYKPEQMRALIYSWFSPQKFLASQFHKYSPEKVKQIRNRTVSHLAKLVKQTNDLIEALKQTYDGIFQSIEKMNSFIEKCMNLVQDQDDRGDWTEKEINHYRMSFKVNINQGSLYYEVKLVCLTPSLTFADLLKLKPRTIILTSGTLSPIDAWQKQLRLKFHIQLVNKHVIQPNQMHLGIVTKGYDNNCTMNFSYQQMQKSPQKLIKNLLQTIIHLCSIIPNGVLVIFPSYRVKNSFRYELQKDTQLAKRLRDNKYICFEDKGTVDYTILNFKNKAKIKKGAVLFCVCRGKVSQGLDFADELCRAVIFIGVPYPNVKDPILKQKRDYYDKLSSSHRPNQSTPSSKPLSGDEWYTLSTMRSVNQGIGRVIRHINDYGMILMLDNRYEQPRLKSMLPAWSKNSIRVYGDFEEVDDKVKEFFKDMAVKFPGKDQNYQEQEQEFSEVVPTKKNLYQNFKFNEKQTKKQTKVMRNSFQIMMNQARQNGDKKGWKKKKLDFL